MDFNQVNFDGRNLGHVAASEGKKEIIDYLAKTKRYNFFAKDRWGKTTFDIVKWSEHFPDGYAHNLQQLLKK